MQRNGACQCVCMCIHLPLHTFRNHNGKYILKWKHQRTYLWPCSDTTHSVSQRWCWFTPEWGQRAESLSTQSSRGSKKSAWGFSPLLLCFFRSLPWMISASSSSRTWMWQLLRLCISGKGEQLCADRKHIWCNTNQDGSLPTVPFLSWNLAEKHNRGSWVCC